MSEWSPLHDLIWLFEVEPDVEHNDVDYPVSATTFTAVRGDTLIECTVEPFANSVSIRCAERGQERFRLHLWGIVEAVHVDRAHDREALVVSIVEAVPLRDLRLELKPVPRIFWESVAPWER